jgi:hypothetical protein
MKSEVLELDLKDLRLEDVIALNGMNVLRGIQGYEVIGDLIHVHGGVDLSCRNLTAIPWRFGRVSGDFHCHHNHLITLEGAPQSVGGEFNCAKNQLTTLKGAPQSVGGHFVCSDNKLKTLEGAPISVGRDFICYDNPFVSHAGKPAHIGGVFITAD